MPGKPPFHVLVAEDEYFVAREIVRTLERAGAVVLGPVPDLDQAYRALDVPMEVDLAILDVRLGEELVFPLADHLAKDGVPLVFYTGYEKTIVPERFHDAVVVSKSNNVSLLLDAVAERQLDAAQDTDLIGEFALGVTELLPELRFRARQLVGDVDTADKLVEETLETALASLERRPWTEPAPRRLRRLLYQVYQCRIHRLN